MNADVYINVLIDNFISAEKVCGSLIFRGNYSVRSSDRSERKCAEVSYSEEIILCGHLIVRRILFGLLGIGHRALNLEDVLLISPSLTMTCSSMSLSSSSSFIFNVAIFVIWHLGPEAELHSLSFASRLVQFIVTPFSLKPTAFVRRALMLVGSSVTWPPAIAARACSKKRTCTTTRRGSISYKSISLATLSIELCEAEDDRRPFSCPSKSTWSADLDRRLSPPLVFFLSGLVGGLRPCSMNSSTMVITTSTSYRISSPSVKDAIRRSLTLASSNCTPALLARSNFEVEEAFNMFAALRSFSKKLQETEPFSIGSKITIFSRSRVGENAGGESVDAPAGDLEILAEGRKLPRVLQGEERVLPTLKDAGLEERLELSGEIAAVDGVGHEEVFGGTAQGNEVERADGDGDAVAEFCAKLEGVGAAGDVGEIDCGRRMGGVF
ncbi:hypothetical protein IEQ34_004439 [Dendrobium chrysotoxum]|uniref:Uncharacterized protein n=1 Tax=Dendrobium chrysotoxum TaxID=161865 RepID=A0AAV7HE13_DENCH|nr:hypothetical protein IEQ34_004439 [Dendrobium chrysotoxum]